MGSELMRERRCDVQTREIGQIGEMGDGRDGDLLCLLGSHVAVRCGGVRWCAVMANGVQDSRLWDIYQVPGPSHIVPAAAPTITRPTSCRRLP